MHWTIHWIEYTDRTGEALARFLRLLPNPVHSGGFWDGVEEYECHEAFEAETLDEAKRFVRTAYPGVAVFVCLGRDGQPFTEDDL